MQKSVFISRSLRADSVLKLQSEKIGFQIIDRSLLRFSAVDFGSIPEVEWVFFYSPKCVHFFLSKVQLPPEIKLAAMGPGTATAIHELGYAVDFIGTGIAADVAQVLAKKIDTATILFPRGTNSSLSVQRQLPSAIHVKDLIVYQNEQESDIELPFCDYLLFTSSMNAKAYFNKYPVDHRQGIVAIGQPTAVTLREIGVVNYKTAPHTSEEGLWAALQAYLTEVN